MWVGKNKFKLFHEIMSLRNRTLKEPFGLVKEDHLVEIVKPHLLHTGSSYSTYHTTFRYPCNGIVSFLQTLNLTVIYLCNPTL